VIAGSLLLILVAVTLLVLGLANGSSGLLISSIAASLLAAVALVVGARQAAAARNGIDHPGDGPMTRVGGEGHDPVLATRWPTATVGGAPGESGSAAVVPVPTQGRPGTSDDDLLWRASGDASLATPSSADRERSTIGWSQPASAADQSSPVADQTSSGGYQTGAGPAYAAGVITTTDAPANLDSPSDEPGIEAVSPEDAARVARLATEVLVVDGRPRYHLPHCAHLDGRQAEPLPVSEAVELGFSPCAGCEPDSALLGEVQSG
jgi:hypothetical protein